MICPPLWLSPMEGVTDPAFRHICKCYGADVLVTEFVSSEALIRQAHKSFLKMRFDPMDRPTAIQIFGYDEKSMCEAAEIAAQQEPDFIDLNWGCPVRKVVSKGAGAGILRNIPKMISITSAVVQKLSEIKIPVTVKTRLGWDNDHKPIVEIAERLQDVGIAALSIHGRTRTQLYSGTADYTLIKAVKENSRMCIPVCANGDIDSAEKARWVLNYTGADGLLIGRAAIGNPWIFAQTKHFFSQGEVLPPPLLSERVKACLDHLKSEIEINGENVACQIIKIHYSGYFRGLSGFKPFKSQLMLSSSYVQVEEILRQYTQYFSEHR